MMEGSKILDRFTKLNEDSSNWGQSAIKDIMERPVFRLEPELTEDNVKLEVPPEDDEGISIDEQNEENGRHIYFNHNIRAGLHCLSVWLKNPQLFLPEEWKVCTNHIIVI